MKCARGKIKKHHLNKFNGLEVHMVIYLPEVDQFRPCTLTTLIFFNNFS
jgi:hypothetical protein